MSPGLDFENAILEHINKKNLNNVVLQTDFSDTKNVIKTTVPSISYIFIGICIGSGLAAHGLLLNWNK
jgi:hypothetical protein